MKENKNNSLSIIAGLINILEALVVFVPTLEYEVFSYRFFGYNTHLYSIVNCSIYSEWNWVLAIAICISCIAAGIMLLKGNGNQQKGFGFSWTSLILISITLMLFKCDVFKLVADKYYCQIGTWGWIFVFISFIGAILATITNNESKKKKN